MKNVLFNLINLDARTMVALLFWGNLTSVALILTYRISSKDVRDKKLSRFYVCAKFLQGLGYLFLFFRGSLRDVVSVHLGNSLLITGFYFEALSIFLIIHDENKIMRRLLLGLLMASLLVFNITELVNPNSGLRVAITSFCVFLILIIPSIRLLLFPKSARFKRVVGAYYLVFLMLLIPRAVYALMYNGVDLFTNYLAQSLTFLSLLLLLIFSLSAYLLLMKEQSDKLIRYMASTDALSGISNRQSFLDAAEVLFDEYREDGKAAALLFFDIDHFKKVNDSYGHAFGDEVIVRFAEIIKKNMRPSDLSCRYGGEEFLAFLIQNNPGAADKIARRIMKEIGESVFESEPGFSFTTSIGIAWGIPQGGDTLSTFIEQADKALYEAKHSGRNRIVEYKLS